MNGMLSVRKWLLTVGVFGLVALPAACASRQAVVETGEADVTAGDEVGIAEVENGVIHDDDILANLPTWADPDDPRIGLAPGWKDAAEASENMRLIAHRDRPEGFFDPDNLGNLMLGNSDMAFRGNLLFTGSFNGFNIYDISNPAAPRLRTSYVCPGGQGDLSVYGNLMFMSVEVPNGRVDCGTEAPQTRVSPERFLGVRIFDISDIENPVQVGGVQTCRGSHTHTLVEAPDDPDNVYIFVQGTSGVRPSEELPGCVGGAPDENPETALFRIEVIRVPLAAPEDASIVNAPRIFADAETGEIAGLWPGGAHGEGTQQTSTTNQCHDITVYEELGLAAGACSGNGILLDISNPVEPRRVAEVIDPNFAYWHSATFSNDGETVLFTDEWGGGGAPRCLATDKYEWGADAMFARDGHDLTLAGYYKLPAPQTELENCVAHNGSLVPVPGRDIMAQSWYQGGVSILDFTDPANAYEIAYFDRGPIDGSQMQLAGFWSSYWYNGAIYATEIGRGIDVFELTPGEHLSENELAAAKLVQWEQFNPQTQKRIDWPADPVVAHALLDQLAREGEPREGMAGLGRMNAVRELRAELDEVSRLSGDPRRDGFSALAETASDLADKAARRSVYARRLGMLAETFEELAGS
jgi:hypothetical protein